MGLRRLRLIRLRRLWRAGCPLRVGAIVARPSHGIHARRAAGFLSETGGSACREACGPATLAIRDGEPIAASPVISDTFVLAPPTGGSATTLDSSRPSPPTLESAGDTWMHSLETPHIHCGDSPIGDPRSYDRSSCTSQQLARRRGVLDHPVATRDHDTALVISEHTKYLAHGHELLWVHQNSPGVAG